MAHPVSASLALLRPTSPTWTTSQPSLLRIDGVRPRATLIEQKPLQADSRRNDTVVQVRSGELECLPNVVGLELGVLAEKIFAIGIRRHGLDHAANGQSHPANRRLAAEDLGVRR